MDPSCPPPLQPHQKFSSDHLSATPELPRKGGSLSVQAPALIYAVSVDQHLLVLRSQGDVASLTGRRATAHGTGGQRMVHTATVCQLETQTCPNCQRQSVLLPMQSQAPCLQAARKSGSAACSSHCFALPCELQGQNMLELHQSSCHLSQDKAVREKDDTERLCQQSSFSAVSKHDSRQSPNADVQRHREQSPFKKIAKLIWSKN